jgi:hypothetical protein
MDYTLKGIKTFRGTDGDGLNATLYRDGVKVAFILDEGNGGDMHLQWFDQQATRMTIPWVDYQGKPCTIRCTPEEAKLYEFLRGKTWTFGKEFGKPDQTIQTDPDDFIAELAEKTLNDNRFQKMCKTKVLFRLKTDKEGEWRTFKSPFTKNIKDWIVTKFGDQVDSIMNETLGQVAQ